MKHLFKCIVIITLTTCLLIPGLVHADTTQNITRYADKNIREAVEKDFNTYQPSLDNAKKMLEATDELSLIYNMQHDIYALEVATLTGERSILTMRDNMFLNIKKHERISLTQFNNTIQSINAENASEQTVNGVIQLGGGGSSDGEANSSKPPIINLPSIIILSIIAIGLITLMWIRKRKSPQ